MYFLIHKIAQSTCVVQTHFLVTHTPRHYLQGMAKLDANACRQQQQVERALYSLWMRSVLAASLHSLIEHAADN